MYALCILVVMSCAFVPRGSAAPQALTVAPRSQPESSAERSEQLQEEAGGQEGILSKVGGKVPFLVLYKIKNKSFIVAIMCVEIQTILEIYIHPLLFVAAG